MFVWHGNTKIITDIKSKPVMNVVSILERDMKKVFLKTGMKENYITLIKSSFRHSDEIIKVKNKSEFETDFQAVRENLIQHTVESESYQLVITDREIHIYAGDDLGFVYGLLYLSEQYLEIKPFWFWMDQKILQKEYVGISNKIVTSERPVILYRGWFFNDEVLMMKWKYNENNIDGWKMALEALLRCGGNMVIPGTDQMSRKNWNMAADMGLWITHHHAEPLGAELFSRVYPELEANYCEYPEKFEKIWEDAVQEQKDFNVVWNVCFRGQGDAPFWSSDTSGMFDTPEKRGKMISEIIKKQCDIVRKYVNHPVFCTNLYGEIMELYEQGYIKLDDTIIKIRADNGFGKMVSRRQNNHNPRVNAMPDRADKGLQGIYYHVSFYDLQAANHITMLPNSVEFVDDELSKVIENNGKDFWIINCSNVRPHTYYLDVIRKKWYGRVIRDEQQAYEFAEDYYCGNKLIAECYKEYPNVMLRYGKHEDEHAGEQFYTENIRLIANQFIRDRFRKVEGISWFANQNTLEEQVHYFSEICGSGLTKMKQLLEKCMDVGACPEVENKNLKMLFKTTLELQVFIHYYCAKGVKYFGQAFEAYEEQDFEKAFVLFGQSAECFELADTKMRDSEYGNWLNFYKNECLADIKHTAYMVKKVMSVIRELGDNERHDAWYRKYCYAKEDRNIFLLLVTDNHMIDWELYQVMKKHFKTKL